MKNKTSKSLIVSPYLDTLGGGERYMLSIAEVLESLGHEIYFGWDDTSEIKKISSSLNIDINKLNIDPYFNPLNHNKSLMKSYINSSKYENIFYLSDGSVPFLFSKNNILHFQVPFSKSHKSLKNLIKLRKINTVIVNSKFTKKFIDESYGVNSIVIYPPVELIGKGKKLPKSILSVGRFDGSINIKRQDILIQAFKMLSERDGEWRLDLAGSSKDSDFISNLKKEAKGHNINFHTNISSNQMKKLYQQSQFYWHAAGYEIDENKNPELVEHFGISTVEAISAGCIPLVHPKGGQKEIIQKEEYYWKDNYELVKKTLDYKLKTSIIEQKTIELFKPYRFKALIKQITS